MLHARCVAQDSKVHPSKGPQVLIGATGLDGAHGLAYLGLNVDQQPVVGWVDANDGLLCGGVVDDTIEMQWQTIELGSDTSVMLDKL